MDLTSLKDYLTSVATLLTILKNAKDMIPKGPLRDDAERALAEAERALKISEASAASALNYQICRCTWPPQIATSIGVVGWEEKFRCPACGKTLPEDSPPLSIKPMSNY
jgi:hypothetical protein